MPDRLTIDFLIAASRHVPNEGWMFTGFNWPILAVRTARRLGRIPIELFESGQAVDEGPSRIPSSTTDYHELADTAVWSGTTLNTFALIGRCEVVMLDAAVVDSQGRVNSFGSGPVEQPSFRSAGGGGSADAAARARRLVLLHGGSDIARLSRPLEHVTAAPSPSAEVLLVTRWGTARLGATPSVIDVADSAEADTFVRLFSADLPSSHHHQQRPATTGSERLAATAVLTEAGLRGYRAGLPAASHARPITSGRIT